MPLGSVSWARNFSRLPSLQLYVWPDFSGSGNCFRRCFQAWPAILSWLPWQADALSVRQGASCAGDDALALVISKVTGCRISRAYLLTDVSVLVLSLSYIPAGRIVYSLITVTVSSFLIDFIQNFGVQKEDEDSDKETLADNG